MKPFECDGCVHYKSVGMDTNGKNKAYSCSNTDRRCYERLQFFNNMLTKLRELKDDVKAEARAKKRGS